MEKTNVVTILGVGVDLNSSDIKKAQSVEDLHKLDIFGHLSKKSQEEGYKQLTDALANVPQEEE